MEYVHIKLLRFRHITLHQQYITYLEAMRLQVLTAASVKMTAFCYIAPSSPEIRRRFRGACLNALMMEAIRTSETSVDFNEIAQRYVLEYCRLQVYF
jgi:hypothetical protein